MGETEEDFFNRLSQTVENGYTCLSIAVGHHLGLFDMIAEFASEKNPKTSAEIAENGKFKERYVREWLGAMVCGRIMECDQAGNKFWIPKHRIEALKRRSADLAEPGVLVGLCSAIPMFGSVAKQIEDCFQLDGPGGVGYDKFTYFAEFMSEVSSGWQEKHLLEKFIPQIPDLSDKLSQGITVLDVGCGCGNPSILLAKAFPKSQFFGIDFTDEVIAKAKSESKQCENTHFESMDAAHLRADWSDKFDYVTAFDAIHDQAYPDKVLKEIHRVLKPGGIFSMVDLKGKGNPYLDRDETPFSAMNYSASLFHCMTVSLYYEGGMGLGNMWGETKAKEMLAEAEFRDVQILDMAGFSTESCHYFSKK